MSWTAINRSLCPHIWFPSGFDQGALQKVFDADDLFGDDDLDLEPIASTSRGAAPKKQAAELLPDLSGLSARERNRLKRKAKASGKAAGAKGCAGGPNQGSERSPTAPNIGWIHTSARQVLLHGRISRWLLLFACWQPFYAGLRHLYAHRSAGTVQQ